MEREEVIQSAVQELKTLAKRAGKTLSEKTLKSLFLKKKAYQKDWPQMLLRRKATLIAGATILTVGEPTEAELKAAI